MKNSSVSVDIAKKFLEQKTKLDFEISKELILKYDMVNGNIADQKVIEQTLKNAESVFIKLCSRCGFNPNNTFFDENGYMYEVSLNKKVPLNYKLKVNKIKVSQLLENVKEVFQREMFLKFMKTRTCASPKIKHIHGIYRRNQLEASIRQDVYSDNKKRYFDLITINNGSIKVNYAMPNPGKNMEFGKLLEQILTPKDLSLLENYLSVFFYENRDGLKKPILLVSGHHTDIFEKIFQVYLQTDFNQKRIGENNQTSKVSLFRFSNRAARMKYLKVINEKIDDPNEKWIVIITEKGWFRKEEFGSAEILIIKPILNTALLETKSWKDTVEEGLYFYISTLEKRYLNLIKNPIHNNEYGISLDSIKINIDRLKVAKFLWDIYKMERIFHYSEKVSSEYYTLFLQYYKDTRRLHFNLFIYCCRYFAINMHVAKLLIRTKFSDQYAYVDCLEKNGYNRRFCTYVINWEAVYNELIAAYPEITYEEPNFREEDQPFKFYNYSPTR